jgi:diacylglycerol kinase (ATP)
VVAGGDGAMRLAAPSACRTRTPVYHLPLGTENLFAREFGMDRRDHTLLRAIESQRVRTVDIALANHRWFLLMASVGFDAEVVHTLAATRGGSISHLTYIKPILATMRTWTPPRLTVEVDGERIVTEQPGIVVVANCRQYGWRIDPAARADMGDGLLDVAFLPAGSLWNVLGWVVRCRLRRQYRHGRFVSARGRGVFVRSDRASHFQLDGDPPGIVHELLPEGFQAAGPAQTEDQSQGPLSLQIHIVPGLLRVLTAGDGP